MPTARSPHIHAFFDTWQWSTEAWFGPRFGADPKLIRWNFTVFGTYQITEASAINWSFGVFSCFGQSFGLIIAEASEKMAKASEKMAKASAKHQYSSIFNIELQYSAEASV